MKQIFVISIILVFSLLKLQAQDKPNPNNEKLMVVWSSGDKEVALNVCLMYTHAAKKYEWFKEVYLIVWGPSAKLLSEDKELQEKLAKMQKDGVILEACVACANKYGVANKLKSLEIDVKGMGVPLTNRLKSGWKQLNF